MMCGPYWNQWDKEDLDSWQGKDIFSDDYELDDEIELEEEYEDSCSCGNYCFDCLGISWHDFM